ITRPSDILYHAKKSKIPFVISPKLVDYSEFDKTYRKGISGFVLRKFSGNQREYIKTIAVWCKRNEVIKSKSYLWKGQKNSIREVLQAARMILPNSAAEYDSLKEKYGIVHDFMLVPNGVDTSVFTPDKNISKNNRLVICAARLEGLKNQANLIKAITD